MKRAIRRHHYYRLKRKRANHYGGSFRDCPETIAMLVTTPTPCSCSVCGNWRKLGVLSTQECRHEAACAVDEDLIYHRVS